MNRTRLFLLGLPLLATPATMQAQFDYTVTNGAITLTNYTGSATAVTLPSAIVVNGVSLPVTGLGANVFFDDFNVTSVTIPSSITNIADSAFAACYGLTTLKVDSGNPAFVAVSGVLFNLGETTLIQYPEARGGNAYTIPGSVANIGAGAFGDCYNLTSVTIPTSVSSIGAGAFELSFSLTSITIPNSVTNIGDLAFAACSSLVRATVGSNVISVENSAFANCSVLTNVTLPNGIASLGGNAFAGSGLTSIMIPRSVTNIGALAFASCYELAAINVDPANPAYASLAGVLFNQNQTTLIQYPAGKTGSFYAIPDGVTSIAAAAFSGSKVGSVTIPNGVASIGDLTFSQSGALTNITIPNSVTNIGASAFQDCHLLAGVLIPNGVINIGTNAFYDCGSLTTVLIPASVTSLGDSPFGECARLAAVNVDPGNPAYVSVAGVLFNRSQTTLIQYPAGKTGNSYAVPASVTSLGDRSFAYCASLAGVYFQGNAPAADSTAFLGDNSATVYYLPNTTGWSVTFANLPGVPWNPAIQIMDGSFGIHNGQIGFNITSAANLTVVVQACANLANPVWIPLQTITLTNGLFYFSEPLQASSGRFYGLGLP